MKCRIYRLLIYLVCECFKVIVVLKIFVGVVFIIFIVISVGMLFLWIYSIEEVRRLICDYIFVLL